MARRTHTFLPSITVLGMLLCVSLIHRASAKEETGFVSLFDGKDLQGWHMMGHEDWHAENGILWTEGKGGWLRSDQLYADFVLRLEYQTAAKSNSGIFLRAAEEGNPAFTGVEIQILDDAGKPADVHSSASIYGAVAPRHNAAKPAGQWNQIEISCIGRHVMITLNGHRVQDANLDGPQYEHAQTRPLSKVPDSGYIGLQSHTNRVEFRNLRIKVLKSAP